MADTTEVMELILKAGSIRFPTELLSESPSLKDGVDPETESTARAIGCQWIVGMASSLDLPQATVTTSCMLLQRFYYSQSLIDHHPKFTAAACLYFGCQLEETSRKPHDILKAYLVKRGEQASIITRREIQPYEKAFKEKTHIVQRSIGFGVIVRSPLVILEHYMNSINLGDEHHKAANRAQLYLQVSLFTDLCVRFKPETIAVACILLATEELGITMPPYPHGINELHVRSVASGIIERGMKSTFDEDQVQHALQQCLERKFAERRANYRSEACISDVLSFDSESESDSEIKQPAGSFGIPIGYSQLPMRYFQAFTKNSQIPTQPIHFAPQFFQLPMQPHQQQQRPPQQPHPVIVPPQQVQVATTANYWRPWQSSCYKRTLVLSSDDAPAGKRQRRSPQ